MNFARLTPFAKLFLVCNSVLLLSIPFSCQKKTTFTGKWLIFEDSIQNRQHYLNPFEDVSLVIYCTRPDGSKLKYTGFYAGDKTWKLRIMPDQIGEWSYNAVFSDGSKKLKGSFKCIDSDIPGMISLYKENPVWFGFKGGRAVILRSFHAGDRFFSDTSNLLTGEGWNESDRKRFLNWLQENRYNMISIASHYLNRDTKGRGKGWKTPALWDENTQMPVPSEYDRMEKILDELSERKIILYPFAGFLGRNSNFPADNAKMDTYIAYTMARLGSYWNVIYNVAGPEPALMNNPYLTPYQIVEIGKKIRDLNVFGHLLSIHCPTGDSEFKNESWIDFVTLQGPKTTDRKKLSEGLLRNHPDGKGLYAQETLWPGNIYHPGYTKDDIRKNTIVIMMAASMINFADMNGDSSSGFSGNLNPDSANVPAHNIYHQTLDFFESFEFFRLKPYNNLTDNGYCLALPGVEYLVYLECKGSVNVKVIPGKFKVKWINAQEPTNIVETGITTDGRNLVSPDHGDDWYLRLISEK